MSYFGYVTELKKLSVHPNADKLQMAEVFGTTVCVGLDMKLGDTVLYFPTDGQLSEEFCAVHDLVRRKDENGNPAGGYLEPGKRNVKTIRLRGEASDGLIFPISCLDYCFEDGNAKAHLSIGDRVDVVNGHEICRKYIPRSTGHRGGNGAPKGNRTRKVKVPTAPLFKEHADTEQLAYNLSAFKPGDFVEITLKMHGTSQRTGYLPVLQGYKRTWKDRLLRKEGTPIYDWGYVTGTRRTVLDSFDGGFYGSNSFREQHAKVFEGKLPKGFTVYYEVVGFIDKNVPIMPRGNNKKLGKDFVKKYGETTTFSYGCEPEGYKMQCGYDDLSQFSIQIKKPQSDLYVYRITITNEDGDVIELSPDQMRYYCELWGVKSVLSLWKGFIPTEEELANLNKTAGEWISDIANSYVDGPDLIDPRHIREGVVVRILNRPKFTAYKTKGFEFKVLEGLIKESAEAPDVEEAEEENKTE